MRRVVRLAVAAFACATALPATALGDVPEGDGPGAEAGAGAIELLSASQLSPRLEELSLRTPAVAEPTGVRVLLPSDYDAHPKRRYPVLYLLHGGFDDYRAYTDKSGIEEITAGEDLIVVMPDTGPVGGYNDWYNDGAFGPPAWETYHVAQLIPWIDDRYRTVAGRRGRALTGLSMGGGGTMGYASRHPDMFVHAAGFSPAVNLAHPNLVLLNHLPLANGGFLTPPSQGTFGAQEVRWRGVNPLDLAGNLRGVELSMRTGDGEPGGEHGGDVQDIVERSCYEMALAMHERLGELGIDHLWDYYGAGVHSWPYWQRDLELEIPRIVDTFADPPPRPRRFSYRSIDAGYDVWGWEVEIDRAALEFSRLAAAGKRRFRLSGSGAALVRTRPVFDPGSRYTVKLRGDFGERTRRVSAGNDGRLEIAVPLGPANAAQQYTDAVAAAGGTKVYETRVAIAGPAHE